MAKLYFRYGTVSSAKTLNLLAVVHNYGKQNKRALLLKPALDNRFGADAVKSRAGLETNADLLLEPDSKLDYAFFRDAHCIIVDEAQFLSAAVINQLRDISLELDIPVICYGLRTDFRTQLFEGSRRLLELADSIEEVKTTCFKCNKKAIFNLRTIDGKPSFTGPSTQLGGDESYQPMCARCYMAAAKLG